MTYVVVVCLIGTDPRLDFWSLHAECTYPANPSTPNVRVTSFTYDLDGRLAQVNCPEGVINYGYNPATGRLTTTCTTNSEVDYTYDQLGRLKTVHAVKRNGVAVNETATYGYDAVGNRQSLQLPNGVVTTYFYDSLNRLTNLTHQAGPTNLASYTYRLDATGRRTNAVEVLRQEDNTYLTNSLSWAYDRMYRLTNEVCASASSYCIAYQYDDVGNRLQKLRTVGSQTETNLSLFDNNDELLREEITALKRTLSTNFYAYDLNGSVTGKTNVAPGGISTTNYAYNLANKLSAVTIGGVTTSYLYNDQGIRVSASTPGQNPTLYLVDANNRSGYAQVLEELNSFGGTPTTSYVIGDDVLAQCGATTAAPSYFLHDGHGSTRQLSRTDGTVSSHYNYDAYGVGLESSTVTPETANLYCGEQLDPTLQMYNLRARFYDPVNGRFSQRDTFAGNNFDPRSLHKYTYAHEDPVTNKDPSGQFLLIDLLLSSAIRFVWAGLKTVGTFIVKKIAEKSVFIIAGAVSGFLSGFIAGLFAELAGVEQDPLLLGILFAIAGAVQGLLAPLSMKQAALFGFVTSFMATLAHDKKLTGSFDFGKAFVAGIFGGLGALAGSTAERLLLGSGVVKWYGYDQFGNIAYFVPAEEVVEVFAVNAGTVLGDILGAFLWMIPEMIFHGSVQGQSVKPLLEN